MNEVEIINSIDEIPFDLDEVRNFIESVLRSIHAENWRMGLLITTDEGIREYNRRWRGKDSATDVLSFVQMEGQPIPSPKDLPNEAGDIIVSLERVRTQSVSLNCLIEEEFRRVIVHGILHLNGMVHPDDDYGGEMLRLQERIVSKTKRLAVNA